MDDATPTDPALTLKNALERIMTLTEHGIWLNPSTTGEIHILADDALYALPLSTPVVAHQGAESDRQAAIIEGLTRYDAEMAACGDSFSDMVPHEHGKYLLRSDVLAALSPTPGAETPTFAAGLAATAARFDGLSEGKKADYQKMHHRDLGDGRVLTSAEPIPAPIQMPPAETDAAAIRAARADGMREAVPIFLTAADPGPPEDGNYAQTWAVHLQIKGAKAVHAAANELAIPQPTPEPQGWSVAAERSRAIREFCEKVGVPPRTEAENIPSDVRGYRLDTTIAARRPAAPMTGDGE